MTELNVHILNLRSDESLALLGENLLGNIKLSLGENIPEGSQIHILVGGRPEENQIKACPLLKALIIPYAGLHENTRTIMQDYPHISVHNLHHNAAPTAEVAIALLMAAAKYLIPYDQSFRKHDWHMRYINPVHGILLEGKTALILGFGEIGHRLGKVCHALGMKVLGIKKNVQAGVDVDFPVEIYPQTALHELLPRTNVLMISIPLTGETENMIDRSALDLLPPDSLLINVGRGGVVNQKALYQSLKTKKLGGAGLDVWYNYPEDKETRSNTQPGDFPFHELDNLVMSPHRGGLIKETEQLRMLELARVLNMAASGDEIPNRVDLTAGY